MAPLCKPVRLAPVFVLTGGRFRPSIRPIPNFGPPIPVWVPNQVPPKCTQGIAAPYAAAIETLRAGVAAKPQRLLLSVVDVSARPGAVFGRVDGFSTEQREEAVVKQRASSGHFTTISGALSSPFSRLDSQERPDRLGTVSISE